MAWLTGALSHTPEGGGLIPSQSTCLDCGFDPRCRLVWEVADQCFSLSLSHSLLKVNGSISLGEDF